jgi:hypothetical protein
VIGDVHADVLALANIVAHAEAQSTPERPAHFLFLGDFVDGEGNALAICPRRLLRRVVDELAESGTVAKCGLEFEWFNFRETPASMAEKGYIRPQPLSPGMFGYSLIRMGQNLPFFNALMDDMGAFGVPIEGLHTETGPGVFEAAILYSGARGRRSRLSRPAPRTSDIPLRGDAELHCRWTTSCRLQRPPTCRWGGDNLLRRGRPIQDEAPRCGLHRQAAASIA